MFCGVIQDGNVKCNLGFNFFTTDSYICGRTHACTVAALSICTDIHFVFSKFAASVVVVLIHIDTQLLCRVIRWILNKSFIGPPKRIDHKNPK